MNKPFEYFDEQINFLVKTYTYLQQSYGYLAALDTQNVGKQKGITKLLGIESALKAQEKGLQILKEKVQKLKDIKNESSAFKKLSTEIETQVDKQLADIIKICCPDSSSKKLIKLYSSLLKDSSKAISDTKNTAAIVEFVQKLQEFFTLLKPAFVAHQATIERELPQNNQQQLMVLRAGVFGKLPKDITHHILSYVLPSSKNLLALSQTCRFFKSTLENSFTNHMDKARARQINISLIGDSDIGIRSLVYRIINGKFNNSGFIKALKENHLYKNKQGVFLLEYDTPKIAGRDYPSHHNHNPYAFSSKKIPLICFDITSRISFNNVKGWISELERYSSFPKKPLIIGLKSDNNNQRVVSKEEADEFAEMFGADYIETSAKTGLGIDTLLEKIAAIYLEMQSAKAARNKLLLLRNPETEKNYQSDKSFSLR